MKSTSLKRKIRNNQVTIGSWITLSHPSIAEIMVQAGFDWLTIDLEHSAISVSEAQRLIQVIDLAGCSPLVRVSANEPTIIKRVMDAGAHGVIVPMVNSKAEAQAAVNYLRYPPKGTRGVGLARAQDYGVGFEKYTRWLETESILIVQIEHHKAVANLESILSVDGIDGFMVGPYDLSGSLGMPGDFDHPKVKNALERIKKIAAKKKIPAGIHLIPPDAKKAAEKVKEGFKFIAFSLDSLFLAQTCAANLAGVRRLI